MLHLTAENYALATRRRLLARFREYYDNGFRDPELLYLGGRYAVSLRLNKEADRFLDPLAKMLCPGGKPSPAYAPVGLLYLQILPSDAKERDTVIEHLRGLSAHNPTLEGLLKQIGLESEPDQPPGSPQRVLRDIEQNVNGAGDALLELIQPAIDTEPQGDHQAQPFIEIEEQEFYEAKRRAARKIAEHVRIPGFRPGKAPYNIIEKHVGEEAILKEALNFLEAGRDPVDVHKLGKIQHFAKVATEAYAASDLAQARFALESILLLDGDQPDVLRNLVTITSEQQDIEGYERYWRRYVRVLLWRIMRGDDADCAWDDLTRFYTKVANAADRELNKSDNEVVVLLPRPGFLSRWLEALAGLVWLESATKSRRDLQMNLDNKRLQSGQQGHLALMRYWFRLFYPEFSPFVDIGQGGPPRPAMPSAEAEISLPFNPALKLVSRFLEWAKLSFALRADEEGIIRDRHAETVAAAAGCMARIPIQYYTGELAEAISKDSRGLEQKPLRLVIQEACSFPLSAFKLSAFLDAGDWAGLVGFFGDPDIEDKLTPTIRMFLALALCQTEREFEGLQVACNALPDTSPDDLQEDQQNYNLWRNVLHANIGKALKAEEAQIRELKGQFLSRISDAEKSHKLQIEEAVYDSPSEAWVDILKRQVSLIPDVKHLKVFKQNALEEIEDIYVQQTLVKEVIEKTQELAQKGEFAKARKVIDKLPDDNKDLAELKQQLRSQIDAAEESARLNKQIEEAIEKSKKYVEKGQFGEARRVIGELPDSPHEVKQLKQQFLSQIDEAEKHAKLQERIDKAIKETQRHVKNGNFYQARQVINALPDSPADVRKLKKQLLSQIDEAEKHAKLQGRIDKAIKEAQRHVQSSNFSQARRVINALPDSPADVKKLKSQLLSQIADAERQSANLQNEIADLMNRLQRRGITMDVIMKIAQDNDITITNPGELYGLLRAIDQQL